MLRLDGASGVTRTPDLLITNQLLYRLSYTSIKWYLKHFYNTQAKSIIAHASIRVNKNLRVSFCLSPCKLQIVLLQVFLHNSFVCFAVLTRVLRKSVENSRKTPLKFPIVFCQKSFISERFRYFFGKLQFQINRHNFLPNNLLLEVIHIFHVLFHMLKTLLFQSFTRFLP